MIVLMCNGGDMMMMMMLVLLYGDDMVCDGTGDADDVKFPRSSSSSHP